jgi:hypothetical protein
VKRVHEEEGVGNGLRARRDHDRMQEETGEMR